MVLPVKATIRAYFIVYKSRTLLKVVVTYCLFINALDVTTLVADRIVEGSSNIAYEFHLNTVCVLADCSRIV